MSNDVSSRQISRGHKGRFVASVSNRPDHNLTKQKARQRTYLARASRIKKRIVISFIHAFIVKDQGKQHWIPGNVHNSLLYDLMEALIKMTFLESRRSRHIIVRNFFHEGDPTKCKVRLPRKLVHDAERLESDSEAVPCFLGWRFPCPSDVLEMGDVKTWVRKNEMKLQLSFSDAILACYRMFHRYTKIKDIYLYAGFPNVRKSSAVASAVASPYREITLGNGLCSAASGTDQEIGEDDQRLAGDELREHQQLSPEQTARLRQDNRVLTLTASSDEVYRSLLLILHPERNERFDLILGIWKTYCLRIKSMEKICTFQEDLLEYCCLVLQSNTDCERYHELKRKLNDQLVMFKMIRVALGLTLDREQTPWEDDQQA